LNRKQFEISNDQRQRLVRDFIIKHKGCNKEFVVEGLKDYMSRKTVYKTIELMKEEGQSDEINGGKGNKGHKLIIRLDNPLIYIPLELEEFEKSFFSLFIKAREKAGDSLKKNVLKKLAKKYHWKIKKGHTCPRLQIVTNCFPIFYQYSTIW
jgi:hypothetical protein